MILADKFGASAENNFQMIEPKTLWGLHVNDMPNFYMMVGPQSLNPVTNVTLLCEEQGKYIAKLVSSMKLNNKDEVEPLEEAVKNLRSLINKSNGWNNLFDYLPQNIRDNLENRSATASYFVASLELAKEGALSLRQESFKEEIYLISKTNM